MTMFCDCGNPEAHRGEHIPKPMTDTPLDLDAIEARTNAATDGPWSWEVSDDRRWVDVTAPDYERVIATTHDDDLAEFIAHARTDVPALVAALRKAEAQVARMSLLTTAELVYVSSGELTARAEKAEAQVAAVLAECRKVATVSGNASGYPYVLVNTIVGAIERAS